MCQIFPAEWETILVSIFPNKCKLKRIYEWYITWQDGMIKINEIQRGQSIL